MSKRSAGQGEYAVGCCVYCNPSAKSQCGRTPPRPSGTPLINAGGKGIVLAFGSQLVATEYQEIATPLCGSQ